MEIQSKPIFVPREHHLLLAFLFAFYHSCLLYASFISFLHFFLPLLVCWFLVLAFACTHMERERMELGHDLTCVSKKG